HAGARRGGKCGGGRAVGIRRDAHRIAHYLGEGVASDARAVKQEENRRGNAMATNMDLDKFRLRRFVKRLIDLGEVEIHDEPVPLTRLSEIIESTDKA